MHASFTSILFPVYNTFGYQATLLLAAIGEIAITLWLLVWGAKEEKMMKN
ncbi:MAG: hypothetical protein U5Q03_05720 [Bacteroidota bacterium]|nr:hypothetical protein [Bacteroidota bacterium]